MGENYHFEGVEAQLHYAAFISYAHSDEAKASKLHRLLERYRPPKELKGKRGLLRPVFRDKDELTASHSLTDKIRDAVERSRKLIVLCSPAAKDSKWVNAEIRLFRESRGEAAILCALLEGTPETSFPPALTEGGREPLAADLTGKGDAFRHGALQLAASMMDVGLDDLVRRETRRRRRMGTGVVLGALAFSGVMAASTLSAVKARQLAEDNRAQAEDLVEYMITDLKTKLEPVGRLDILDGVGDKVMEYYSGQDLSEMPDDRIARQAKAMHLLGQVALDEGNYDKAKTQIDAAYALTKEVLARAPNNTDAIFAHAQSAFWVGKVFRDQRLFSQTRPYWQEYSDFSNRLYQSDKNNFDWIMEAAWGESNLGIVEGAEKNNQKAQEHYKQAIMLLDAALLIRTDNVSALRSKTSAIIGAEQLALSEGDYQKALKLKREVIAIFATLLKAAPNNMQLRAELAEMKSSLLGHYGYVLGQEDLTPLILGPLREFGALIQYDDSNESWRNWFIWHHFYAVEITKNEYLQTQVLESFQKHLSKEDYDAFSSSQKFALYFLAAKWRWKSGQRQEALKILDEIVLLQQNNPELGMLFQYFIADTYADFGEAEKAKSFAKTFLNKADQSRTTSKRIDERVQISKARAILGQCDAAKDVFKPVLEIAPKSAPQISEIIINCKP